MKINESPIKIEWSNKSFVLKAELHCESDGSRSMIILDPETNEFLGQLDSEMGGTLVMFDIDIERDEQQYLLIEQQIFFEIHKAYTGFFEYSTLESYRERYLQ